jgi:hypothetical protein
MITKKFGAEFIDEDNVQYPIEVALIQKGLTLEEAKELADDLQAQIEIAEWKDAQRIKSQASIVI